jgi:hypothetical protein
MSKGKLFQNLRPLSFRETIKLSDIYQLGIS